MGQRRLRSGVPRAYADHRRSEALRYRAVVREMQSRHPHAPSELLAEYGRVVVELDRASADGDALRGQPRRRRDLARLERRRGKLRGMMLVLRREIASAPAPRPKSIAEHVAAGRRS